MGILSRNQRRSGKKQNDEKVFVGRVSKLDNMPKSISPTRNRGSDLLSEIKRTRDSIDAIQLLIKKSPDASMAFQTLLRLANQGFDMEFMPIDGNATPQEIQEEWREFAIRVNAVSNAGFDGLIDQLHSSGFAMGGMGIEVVVTRDGRDIEDVYMVSPKTIHWELETREGVEKYIPYQKDGSNMVDLSRGNFFWIPFDSDIGTPQGNLLFEPAVQAIEMQQQFFNSSQIVLYRIGAPRYVFTISSEALQSSMPPEYKNDMIKQTEWQKNKMQEIVSQLQNIGVENDIVTFDDVTVDTKGADSAFFQGVGAYADIIDTQVMNALKMLGTLMNRRGQGSYALSTVEFKIIVDMVESMRKSSKRMAENIARMWCRVKGYSVQPKFTHKPVDWQALKDQIDYKLKYQELVRKSQEYGWIDENMAAQEAIAKNEAVHDGNNLYEYVKYQNTNANTETISEEKSGGE